MRAAIVLPAALLAIATTASSAGPAVVTAPAGPPELLVLGHGLLEPMNRAAYEAEIIRLASLAELVPVHEWPAGLSDDAPRFLTWLSKPMVTLALQGDASSGFELFADIDANGKLDEPGMPMEKEAEGWVATFRVAPPAASNESDRRSLVVIEAKWEQISFQDPGERFWRLKICDKNVRRGVIELAGRKTEFAIAGQGGAYGRGPLEIFFDLDHDGRVALEARYSNERFTMNEERVVVGHTAYRFEVDPAGDFVTLTRLEGKFEPRANLDLKARAPEFTLTDLDGHPRQLSEFRGRVVLLDFWVLGCAPCVWDMPKLAALRDQYGARGFEILGIHGGPLVPGIAETCAAKGAVWPQLVDGSNKVVELYRVDRYPTAILLDRKGRIIEHEARGEALEPAVRKALNR